ADPRRSLNISLRGNRQRCVDGLSLGNASRVLDHTAAQTRVGAFFNFVACGALTAVAVPVLVGVSVAHGWDSFTPRNFPGPSPPPALQLIEDQIACHIPPHLFVMCRTLLLTTSVKLMESIKQSTRNVRNFTR